MRESKWLTVRVLVHRTSSRSVGKHNRRGRFSFPPPSVKHQFHLLSTRDGILYAQRSVSAHYCYRYEEESWCWWDITILDWKLNRVGAQTVHVVRCNFGCVSLDTCVTLFLVISSTIRQGNMDGYEHSIQRCRISRNESDISSRHHRYCSGQLACWLGVSHSWRWPRWENH